MIRPLVIGYPLNHGRHIGPGVFAILILLRASSLWSVPLFKIQPSAYQTHRSSQRGTSVTHVRGRRVRG